MEQIIIDKQKCEDLIRQAEVLVLNSYSSHNIVEIENLVLEEANEIARILKEKSPKKRNVTYDCEVRPIINSKNFIESYKLIVKRG